jgi:hypothetical protein
MAETLCPAPLHCLRLVRPDQIRISLGTPASPAVEAAVRLLETALAIELPLLVSEHEWLPAILANEHIRVARRYPAAGNCARSLFPAHDAPEAVAATGCNPSADRNSSIDSQTTSGFGSSSSW